MKNEYDIHDIIRIHPYILGEEFEGLYIKHEKVYDDRSRADFVFSNTHISIVVEVKIGKIDVQALEQATHYLNDEKKKNPNKKLLGILVGHHISNKQELEEKIKNSGYEFKIKFLDKDIPTEIKLCENCRKANTLWISSCKFCGTKNFIANQFLFISHK